MQKIVDICDGEKHTPKTGSQVTLNNVNLSWKKTIFWSREMNVSQSIAQGCVMTLQDDRWHLFTSDQSEAQRSHSYSDGKVHGANMGSIWGRQDPGGPHVGPMNLAIWRATRMFFEMCFGSVFVLVWSFGQHMKIWPWCSVQNVEVTVANDRRQRQMAFSNKELASIFVSISIVQCWSHEPCYLESHAHVSWNVLRFGNSISLKFRSTYENMTVVLCAKC